MRFRHVLTTLLLAVAVCLTGALPAGAQEVASERLWGQNRYATSAAISRAHVEPGVEVVYVASGGSYPDALSGAPVAGLSSSPVLLVKHDGIPTAVETELERLQPRRIVILGGESAVGPQVEAGLRAHGQVTRMAGAHRYATSARISAEIFGPGIEVAYVASGRGYADALAGAAVAGQDRAPLLLAGDGLSNAVAAELDRLQPGRIVVLGGHGAVPPEVVAELEEHTAGPVTRLAGGNRYETAAVIARSGFPDGAPTAFLASGLEFADALAGAPMAAVAGGPVLLTKPADLPDDAAAVLGVLRPSGVVVLGGRAAISDGVGQQAVAAAQGEVPVPGPPAGYDGQMVELINAERARAGVAPVAYWDPLRTGALAHSRLMMQTGEFEHASASQLGSDIHAADCAATWAENIYWSHGFDVSDPGVAMTAYMNSPGHRANILNPDFAYVAAGTVVRGSELYNTQRFAGVCG